MNLVRPRGHASRLQHGTVLEVVATRHTHGAAFAALLTNGSVVTWGHSLYGGDTSVVQHLLRTGATELDVSVRS